MGDRQYTLKINKRQASVMRAALEAYARLKHGQIEMVMRDLFIDRECVTDQHFVGLCDQLKVMIFPELYLHASYGVGSRVYPESDVAWDAMQVLRHRLAWDWLADEGETEPKHWGVQYNDPMAFSGEPLPKINTATEERD